MIAAALLLAQVAPLAPVPVEPKPVATTIAAIRADPKKFDGALVRVHGYVNACGPSSCLVSERASSAPAGAGAALSIASDDKFDATVRPLLPTYVEFDARFDAKCLIGAGCAGRAPDLTIVSLRAVVSPEPPFEN
jgi:hypothetical protein